MRLYDRISNDLEEAFSSNHFFAMILQLSPLLLCVSIVLSVISCTIGLGWVFGSFLVRIISAIDGYVFLFGALGTYAKKNSQLLFVGLAVKVVCCAILLIRGIIPIHGFWISYGEIANIIVYGYFAWLVYRNSN